MVYAFFPGSSGVLAATPSKVSLTNLVEADRRVKFTPWIYSTQIKKYGFSVPSLPSDLEQQLISASSGVSPPNGAHQSHVSHSSSSGAAPAPTAEGREFVAYIFAGWISEQGHQAAVVIPSHTKISAAQPQFSFCTDRDPVVECVFLGAFLFSAATGTQRT